MEIIELRFHNRWTLARIAGKLGISIGTLDGRLRRALRQLRNRAREAAGQASQWADRGREVVNTQKEQFRAAYEAGRQAYQEATADTGVPKNS